MIMLLDTSTPVCKLYFVDGDWRYSHQWEARRDLAKGILSYVQSQLASQGKTFNDITGIVGYRGPGSFTGLRIGITVLNSLSYANSVPIVGTLGEQWQEDGLRRLAAGETDGVVLPEYGGEAHITTPRK